MRGEWTEHGYYRGQQKNEACRTTTSKMIGQVLEDIKREKGDGKK